MAGPLVGERSSLQPACVRSLLGHSNAQEFLGPTLTRLAYIIPLPCSGFLFLLGCSGFFRTDRIFHDRLDFLYVHMVGFALVWFSSPP